MEAKLKGMKVADLKVILQTANVPFDSKLTKQALIKKILETPAALAVASSPGDNAEADDDLPDLPPSINWDDAPKAVTSVPMAAPATQVQATTTTTTQTKAPQTLATGATTSITSQVAPSPPKNADALTFKAPDIPILTVEDEAKKRRARAAKWGTTYVDPSVPLADNTAAKDNTKKTSPVSPSPDEEERRKRREARFGTSTSNPSTSAVDEEEIRKRKARDEKFGTNKKPRLDVDGSK